MAEVELWSFVLPGGAEEEISPPADIRVTNAAFGEELPDANGRSVVKLVYEPLSGPDDEDEDEDEEKEDEDEDRELAETVLTALTAGRIEQTTLNVVLKEDRQYVLVNTGKNTVYLTGNYIEQMDEPPYDSDEEEYSDEEDAYDLREVSSDVEMDPLELEGLDDLDTDASRFEEIEEPAPKSAKRSRDSEAEEAPKAKDKKSKKLKAEDGKAVPVEATAEKADKKEKKKEKKEKDTKTKGSNVKELAGGLKIQDSKVGEGPEAKKGSKVSVRYIGKLENGKVFDKNTKGKPV
ncbi:peptidylprolyl isomerase, variant 2 [Coprinopsis cinerea AmutBmut pab1-1]|nr:peptidylprolyl isomerase, variant 2 [Coprinopsis cinerea AmutBmut pab1-1]